MQTKYIWIVATTPGCPDSIFRFKKCILNNYFLMFGKSLKYSCLLFKPINKSFYFSFLATFILYLLNKKKVLTKYRKIISTSIFIFLSLMLENFINEKLFINHKWVNIFNILRIDSHYFRNY